MDRKWVFRGMLVSGIMVDLMFRAHVGLSAEPCGKEFIVESFFAKSETAFSKSIKHNPQNTIRFYIGTVRTDRGSVEKRAKIFSGKNCFAECEFVGEESSPFNFSKAYRMECRSPSAPFFSSPAVFIDPHNLKSPPILRFGSWVGGYYDTMLRVVGVTVNKKDTQFKATHKFSPIKLKRMSRTLAKK